MHIKTIIRHRVNSKEELLQLHPDYGVEIDLRTTGERIILNHEPFETGIDVNEYFQFFQHNTCILNTKVDGLEEELIKVMERYNIANYFFLDTTVPTMVKFTRQGFRKIAVRYSEYEPIAFVEQFQGKVDWVWVDCFTRNILTSETYSYLKQDFKLCIVSPELQGYSVERINEFKDAFQGFELDAVCTKRPDLWK